MPDDFPSFFDKFVQCYGNIDLANRPLDKLAYETGPLVLNAYGIPELRATLGLAQALVLEAQSMVNMLSDQIEKLEETPPSIV